MTSELVNQKTKVVKSAKTRKLIFKKKKAGCKSPKVKMIPALKLESKLNFLIDLSKIDKSKILEIHAKW